MKAWRAVGVFGLAAVGMVGIVPSAAEAKASSAPHLARPGARSAPPGYRKLELMVPMRDGVRLYTAVFLPPEPPFGGSPLLLERTPYSCAPYGPGAIGTFNRGSDRFAEAGYAFALQDVRGKFMSEGTYENIRPVFQEPFMPHDVDETTDAWDTVEYLVRNVPGLNGRVGLWGISYPGFYAAMGGIRNHPAVRAISPQAPVAEWWIGDDFRHHGALFLQDAVEFMTWHDMPRPRPGPTALPGPTIDHQGDAYRYYLRMGPNRNVDGRVFQGRSRFWRDLMEHPDYDDHWRSRSLPAQMSGVRTAVLTVGGWFDAEDLYGPLAVYRETERRNPGIVNALVMGPWYHGMWADPDGSRFHTMDFGSPTAEFYREEIEFPFFDAFLRGEGKPVPEARIFFTGSNRWRTFERWPPVERRPRSLVFQPDFGLTWDVPPRAVGGVTPRHEVRVDPADPVPYQGGRLLERSRSYMLDDQRFASARPDVLTYRGPVLDAPVTLAGPLDADLLMSTSGTDVDVVVKLIDQLPDGTERLIRGEIFRGKYRDSFANPKPFVPDQPTRLRFTLPDVAHTFLPGHRLVVQVQNSWFPLADRNPNVFLNINEAREADFRVATFRLHHPADAPCRLRVGVLP